MLTTLCLFLSFNINVVSIPFDNGANIKGSSRAFDEMKEDLKFLNIEEIYEVETKDKHVREILEAGHINVAEVLENNKFPLVIGGDHTIAISSISACNEYCFKNDYSLGIIWFDAHADFNTIESSPTGNLHGVPVSVLCGHTLKFIGMGDHLDPNQFAYYGVRDFDAQEFNRFQHYNMTILHDSLDFQDFINSFDKIHISLDLDCLDPYFIKCVNTAISNGLILKDVINKLRLIRDSGKLISMDLVEYNPRFGNDIDVIIKILNFLVHN